MIHHERSATAVSEPFAYDPTLGVLSNPATCQALALIKTQSGRSWRARYDDPDLTLMFEVTSERMEHRIATILGVPQPTDLIVDFNSADCRSVQNGYAFWRRLSYFLIEAMPVWLEQSPGTAHLYRWLELRGSWDNGSWSAKRFIRSTIRRVPRTNVSPLSRLISLDLKPTSWTFRCGENSPKRIRFKKPPAPEQLRAIPHLLRSDGGAALYHSVVTAYFHRGEDYCAVPNYGYVNDTSAFTVAVDMERWRIHSPMFPGRTLSNFFFRTEHQGALGIREELNLAPELHEELVFALADIWWRLENLRHSEVPTPLPWIEEDVKLRANPPGPGATLPARTGVRFGWGLDRFPHQTGRMIYFDDVSARSRFMQNANVWQN